MQPEVASIPKNASNTASTFAPSAARLASMRKIGVATPWLGGKTVFMSDCIVGERTWGRLLARGTRGGQGGSSVRETAISCSANDRLFVSVQILSWLCYVLSL